MVLNETAHDKSMKSKLKIIQLKSSTSQCTALQEELKAKIDGEHEFEEKNLNLERQCLEQQGFIESLREEKRSIQETSDDLGAQSKGNFVTVYQVTQ